MEGDIFLFSDETPENKNSLNIDAHLRRAIAIEGVGIGLDFSPVGAANDLADRHLAIG